MMKQQINDNTENSWTIFYDAAFTPSISGLSSLDISGMNKHLLDAHINPLKILKYIPERFYYGRDDLTEIIIPDYIEGISIYAFKDCNNLKDIYIPKSVKYIEAGAFLGTSIAHRHVQYEGNLEDWLSIDIDRNDGLTDDDFIDILG